MTLLLLDTTFLIDAERGVTVLDDLIDDDDDIAIAAITVAELTVGALLATGKQRTRRQNHVNDICDTIPIIGYDQSVALHHAQLLVNVRQSGKPRGAHDLIIAATALTFKRTVVTADLTAFTDLPGVTSIGHR